MSGRVAGKVAFVTGAGGAIGGATAEHLAREGAAVACADLDEAAAAATAARIADAGGRAIALACDVARADSVRAALDAAMGAHGALHIVVNTAANEDPTATVVELPEAEWEAALRVNLTGVFLVCKHAIPLLVRSGGGSIVNVASQLGSVAVPRRPAYVTSKAAVIQLSRAMAVDHAADNIRVNSLSPGATETRRLTSRIGSMEDVRKALVPLHPIGRLGRPADIAAAAVFLASDEAAFVTGTDLIVDGGYTAV